MFPVNQSPLLYHKSSTHVASVEVLKFQEVVVNIDKAQDKGADNTNTEECQNDEDLFIVNIVPENICLLILNLTIKICCADSKGEKIENCKSTKIFNSFEENWT